MAENVGGRIRAIKSFGIACRTGERERGRAQKSQTRRKKVLNQMIESADFQKRVGDDLKNKSKDITQVDKEGTTKKKPETIRTRLKRSNRFRVKKKQTMRTI